MGDYSQTYCNNSLDGTNVKWHKTKRARTVVYVKNGRIDPTSVAPEYDEAVENKFEIENGAEDQIQPHTKPMCNV